MAGSPSRAGLIRTLPSTASTFVRRVGPRAATRLTRPPKGTQDLPLSASPDGSRLLFVQFAVDASGNGSDDGILYVVVISGGSPRRLSPAGTVVSAQTFWGDAATWSPDGQRVAFVSFAPGARLDARVDVIGVDGAGWHEIAPAADPYTGAHWSPDGQWILTDREATAGGAELIVVHPDGTGLMAISEAYACCGTWSPDGHRILYLVERSTDAGDLYTAAADGSDPLRLTREPGHYEWYSWAPSPAP